MKKFNPTKFLAVLGSGGISVAPFAFMQNTVKHPKGLIAYEHIGHGTLSMSQEIFFRSLEGVMLLFAAIHFFLLIRYLGQYFSWLGSDDYKTMKEDPKVNSALMTPFLAIFMSFNVVIGVVRFFIPAMHENLTTLVPYAFGGWAFVWFFAMKTEISIIKKGFIKVFEPQQLNFGWLMHAFALGMGSVVGSGIAIFAKKGSFIPDTAALMVLISASMGLFLLVVKSVSLFIGQYRREGLPGRQAMPTFLIMVPIITLYAITFFRLGHFLHKHHGFHVSEVYYWFIIIAAWAFQTWYMFFGFSLLKDYFSNHFKGEYYLSQWGVICPFVGYAVLGSFVVPFLSIAPVIKVISLASLSVVVVLYSDLLLRHYKCRNNTSAIKCL